MLTASRRTSWLPVTLLSIALVAGATPVAQAQCPGPDGLDLGPCCAPVFPNLPPFLSVSLPGLNICFTQCSTAATRTLKVSWTTLVQVACGEYNTTLTVSDGGSGTPLLSGTLVLDYTRTWNEVDTAGNLLQVWRFVAKADLSAIAGVLPPSCSIPNCIVPLGPHPTAFYYGYMDYAEPCVPGALPGNSLVLYHACDRFIHAPGLSDKPGAFHPLDSFAIVAPHDAIQPFVPANSIAASGAIFGEALRDVNTFLPAPNPCFVEDPVVQGSMTKLAAGCLCPLKNNPKQVTLRQVKITTNCVNAAGLPGAAASLAVAFPILPWFHMVTTSIGSWTNPGVYPGAEGAWVDEGLFVHQSACNGDWVELKYGGSTRGGFTAILPVPIPVQNFTDLVDNYTAPLFGPYPSPILGSVRPTDHLLYVNEP